MVVTTAPSGSTSATGGAIERLLRPLGGGTVLVDEPRDRASTWLAHDGWSVFARCRADGEHAGGRPIAAFGLPNGREVSARHMPDGTVVVPFDTSEAYENFIREAWKSGLPRRGLTSRQLDLYYRLKRLIPREVQLRVRRAVVRRQRLPEFPRWPVDTSVSQLLRFHALCLATAAGTPDGEFVWFWPSGQRCALTLTHDVERADGLRNMVEIADLEEELGFRSSFNLGAWYDPDPGVLRDLRSRGFEIGIHGLVHDRSLFESRTSFEQQQPGIRGLKDRFGAEGFRSPATHRVFDWLGELPIAYDCSIPNSDPYEPQPGGCCSVWPFFIGDVVELPWTLTQDHIVFTLLQHRSPALWLEQAATIEREHGLIQCLSHPDDGYLGDGAKREIYREFLRAMAERDGIWHALPRDVAAWWRARDAAGLDAPGAVRGRFSIGEDSRTVELEPSPLREAPMGVVE
jgi:hypothetical protein